MGPKITGDIRNAIKDSLIEMLCDEEFVNKFLIKVNEKLEILQGTVVKNTEEIRAIHLKTDNLQQAEKINNICVYNLSEEQEGNLRENILQVFNDKMNLKVTKQDMVQCYRVGSKSNKPRPVIIRFERYHMKLSILKNCGKLKGTKIGIAEDLIKKRLNLYQTLRKNLGDKGLVFTRYGNIFVRMGDKVEKITNLDEINISTEK